MGPETEAEHSGKYKPLTDYLAALDTDATTMTFEEIEDILGDTLAPSARKYLPYRYSSQNSLGRAIAAAGFRAGASGPTPKRPRSSDASCDRGRLTSPGDTPLGRGHERGHPARKGTMFVDVWTWLRRRS